MFSIIFDKIFFNSISLNNEEKYFLKQFITILCNMEYDKTIITVSKLSKLLDIDNNNFARIWIFEKWFKKIIWFFHPYSGISPYNKYDMQKYKISELNKYLNMTIITNEIYSYGIKIPKLNEIPVPSQIIKCFRIKGFICDPCLRPGYQNPEEEPNDLCGFCRRKAYSWIKTSNNKWHKYCQKPIIYQ